MRAIVTGSYKKINKNGALITMFRCVVRGTPKELEDFKATQGGNHRQDETTGDYLYFTSRPVGKSFDLVKTRGSESRPAQYIPDSSELDLEKAIVANAGGDLGQEIAKIAAHQYMFRGGSNSQGAVFAAPNKDGQETSAGPGSDAQKLSDEAKAKANDLNKA